MLSFFPRLAEDELPYSWAARYKELSGGSAVGILAALVGPKSRAIDVLFPTHLKYLLSQIPKTMPLDMDKLINQHTILPYYTRFFDNNAIKKCRESMETIWENSSVASMFFIKNLPAARRLKFCNMCAVEHLQILDQAVWLRSHQLPGVLVCPFHGTWLSESHVLIQRRQPLEILKMNEACEAPTYRLNYEIALRVARSTLWLLRNPKALSSTSDLNVLMRGLLREKGFGGRGNTIKNSLLRKLIFDSIGKEYLNYIGLNAYRTSSDIWLDKLYRNQVCINLFPIHYLVVISALNIDVSDFFNNETYRCENEKISQCRVRHPPKDLSAKIGLRRNELLAALDANSEATRNYLRKNFGNTVSYLSKHDKIWLYETMPIRKPTILLSKNCLYWNKKDKVLATRALNRCESLRTSLSRPRKITTSSFFQALHFRIDGDARVLLPENMVIINEAVALNSTLTLRRLEWAVSHFEKLSVLPCRSTFVQIATNSSAPLPELSHEIDRLHNLLRDRLEQSGKPIKRVVRKRR